MIACRTTIGFGAPNKGGTAKAHGSALGAAEVAAARVKLGWSYPPFEIPADILAEWRKAGERGKPQHKAWQDRFAKLDDGKRAPNSSAASAVNSTASSPLRCAS